MVTLTFTNGLANYDFGKSVVIISISAIASHTNAPITFGNVNADSVWGF